MFEVLGHGCRLLPTPRQLGARRNTIERTTGRQVHHEAPRAPVRGERAVEPDQGHPDKDQGCRHLRAGEDELWLGSGAVPEGIFRALTD